MAIRKVLTTEGPALIENNRRFHRMLSETFGWGTEMGDDTPETSRLDSTGEDNDNSAPDGSMTPM